jgi:hypothetical protein
MLTLPYIQAGELGSAAKYIIPDVPRNVAHHTPYVAQHVAQVAQAIAIPEFSGLAIVAFSALAASLYLLRRKRR